MSQKSREITQTAVHHFRSARLRADLERIRAGLSGKSADLLSYEEVRQKVKAIETSKRELRDIPLDAIVGSVGRYKDFTRHFLPRVDKDEQRWAKILTFAESMEVLLRFIYLWNLHKIRCPVENAPLKLNRFTKGQN